MELRLLDVAESTAADPAALAAWIRGRCPHVPVDDRLVALGYRFYNLGEGELPPFFSRRFTAGRRNGAVTLLGGVDPRTGEGVLDGCHSADDAGRMLGSGRGGHWLLRLTYGARTITFAELASTIASRDPGALLAFAGELRALGVAEAARCRLCAAA
jgi:hypothetical protein